MKRIATAFALVGMFIFQACEGPEGPQGPPGLDGDYIVGTTYEVDDATFDAAGNYEVAYDLPAPLVDSDVLLIYRLTGVDQGKDVWTILPQTVYFNEGILNYGFDYTLDDFLLFLDGTIDFNLIGGEWTDNQIFRIVAVPSDFPAGRIDYSDYEGVTNLLGIEDEDFIKLRPKK